ncbi:MAG TPA: NAD(P)-dependent oxidoreductase [Microscillaceae bacterium]|nr:NAD(P)-dependent oxidoreductase [Microscillaceae bacterium]
MSKILITGATGGLGSAVADFLSKKVNPANIAVLVRDAQNEKAKALAAKGFELRVGDYTNKASLEQAFTGIDLLYFVSGSDIAARLPQHQNVVEVATTAKVGHIFYTSVSLNNLSANSPLYEAMSHHTKTEEWIKNSGMKYTFLRHNLYGEIASMFMGTKEQLLQSKNIFLPAGSGKTAFVPRIELAEAGANVLASPAEHVNKTYEMNGSVNVTFTDIAPHLSDILGENIGYVSPEVSDFEATLTKFGVPSEYIGLMTVFSLGIAEGLFDSPTTDLEQILGRKTQPVAEFLKVAYQ